MQGLGEPLENLARRQGVGPVPLGSDEVVVAEGEELIGGDEMSQNPFNKFAPRDDDGKKRRRPDDW